MITHLIVHRMTCMVILLCRVCANVAKPSILQQLKGKDPVRHEEQSVHVYIMFV